MSADRFGVAGRGLGSLWAGSSLGASSRSELQQDAPIANEALPFGIVEQFLQALAEFRCKSIGPGLIDQADIDHVQQVYLVLAPP